MSNPTPRYTADDTRAALIAELARLRNELRTTLTTKGEV